jgi:hypothetical protein
MQIAPGVDAAVWQGLKLGDPNSAGANKVSHFSGSVYSKPCVQAGSEPSTVFSVATAKRGSRALRITSNRV